MRKTLCFLACLYLATLATLVASAQGPPAGSGEPPAPPPREIPGITAPDAYPAACVGCHVDMPEMGMDERLSTALQTWKEGADPKLVAKAQGTMPPGVTLTGKHPSAQSALRDIPTACIRCHSASKKAPPFASLVHVVHLTGGADNHFLTIFQGECTHCHKLNQETGEWSVPSGPEASPGARPEGPGRR